jgi:putative ABC transport system permease protein
VPTRLIFRNLLRHKLRTALTVGSLGIAVFLLCVLRALVVSLDAGVRNSTSDRLIVQSAVSLFVNLPASYVGKLRAVEGVDSVARLQWFGGYYQDPSSFFGQFGVDPEEFLGMYPEFKIVEGSRERFLTERTACIVGRQTADRYGFKVGDTVPIIGTIFQRLDGTPWEFQVAGIYELESIVWDETTIFFPFEYLEESLKGGAASGPPGSGVIYIHLAEGVNPVNIAAEVDGLFENGPQRVQTTTEAEFNAQFVSMVGNIPFFVTTIGGGVLAAILLAVINTMLLAGREQRHDMGVLKALGFSEWAVFGVMLGQGVLLCVVGGGLGIGLAQISAPEIAKVLGTMFPGFEMTSDILTSACTLSLGIGLLSGILPAAATRKLLAVDAFRRGA